MRGLVQIAADETIVGVDDAVLDWCGRSRDDVVGVVRFDELLTPSARAYYGLRVTPLLRLARVADAVPLQMRDAAGHEFTVLAHATAECDDRGRLRSATFALERP